MNLLSEKATLNNNPGIVILTNNKITKKDRRHSGRKTIFIDGEYPFMETFYDDWFDYRDGFRDSSDSKKLIKEKSGFWYISNKERKELNNKIKKLLQIKKLMKNQILF